MSAHDSHARGWVLIRLVGNEGGKFTPRRRGDYGSDYDRDDMEAWAASGEPYGVQTGTHSRIVVVDIDPRNLPEGATAQSEITRLGLPNTYSVNTPGGGVHLYCSAPDDLLAATSANNQFGPGVDFKGHNGYVVAPGVHRFDGDYVLGESRTVEALPRALCAIVRDRAAKHSERTHAENVPKNPNPPASTVAKAREDIVAVLADMDALGLLSDGETYEFAGYSKPVGWDHGYYLFAQQLAGIALHADTAYTIEDAESDFKCHAPAGEGTYDPNHKWSDGVRTPYEYKPRTPEVMFPDNCANGDVPVVSTRTAFECAAAAAMDSVTNPPPVLTPDYFNPLGTPLFYGGVLNTLVGPGGIMKTTLALLAGSSHAGHTLFLSLEKSRPSLLNTARWVGAGTSRTLVATSTDEAEAIIASAPPAADLLIVVDSTLSFMARYGWNEDTSTDVGALEAHLMKWYATGRVGCIVLIDHTGHLPGRARGSSRKGQMIQGRVWVLHPDQGSVTVKCEKDNSGERGPSWSYDLTAKGPVATLRPFSAVPVEEAALTATGMWGSGVGKAWTAIREHEEYPEWKVHGLTNRSLRAVLSSRRADPSLLDEEDSPEEEQ